MKFINTANRIIYRSATGRINPGQTTPDTYKTLEKCLTEIIDICGNDMRLVLNANEAKLLAKVMELDEAGSKFNPKSIPASIRNDPTGIKRLIERDRRNQHAALEATARANVKAAEREAMINGEIDEKRAIKPIGVDRNGEQKNEPVSGFDAILAENARIAAGQNQAKTAQEIADPIGANAKQPVEENEAPVPPANDFCVENGAEDAAAPAKKGKGKGRGKAKKA